MTSDLSAPSCPQFSRQTGHRSGRKSRTFLETRPWSSGQREAETSLNEDGERGWSGLKSDWIGIVDYSLWLRRTATTEEFVSYRGDM